MKALKISIVAGLMAAAVSQPANANITFSDSTGGYTVGVGPNGELYDSSTGIGLKNPAGSDWISPGTPRDSWGVTGSTGSAYSDYQFNGVSGVVGTTTTAGVNSATTVTTTSTGLTLTQVFNFFAPNIVSIQETLTNSTVSDILNVVFRRNVDLDVYPTTFNENTFGPLGSNSAVVANSYNGFESANPANAYNYACGASCNQTGDLGAGIDLGLGTIAAGGSATFAYYYGINQPGQTLDQLFTQAQGLGLSYLIGTQSVENGTYPSLGSGSAILGVSRIGVVAGPGAGTGAVPEPATWATMLLGFGLIGGFMRRRNRTTVSFA